MAAKTRRRHEWRETVVETFNLDTITWEQRAEAEALGYQTELEEFKDEHPRPTLKEVMLALAGSHRRDLEDEEVAA